MNSDEIKDKVLNQNKALPIDFEIIKFPFNRIIKDGLSKNPIYRMNFEEISASLDNVFKKLL